VVAISHPIVSFFILTNRAKNGRFNDLLLIVMGDYPLQCPAITLTFFLNQPGFFHGYFFADQMET
jgi:hypothetical protein